MRHWLVLVCLWSGSLAAQTAGVASNWDAKEMVRSLNAQSQRLQPILTRIDPDSWVELGAPRSYTVQWRNTQTEIQALAAVSQQLAQSPERLPLALDAYFRMINVEAQLSSFSEGVRKYQNPAVADILQSLIAENSANRDRLQQYIRDLAAIKEQEFQIADREAQRCRGILTKSPTRRMEKK